ncbi:MAG: hypothetical protein WBA09_21440, partial [Candidatus Acidiferrum sp.]
CPNGRKTWVPGRGWVRMLECPECGNEVEEGETCCGGDDDFYEEPDLDEEGEALEEDEHLGSKNARKSEEEECEKAKETVRKVKDVVKKADTADNGVNADSGSVPEGEIGKSPTAQHHEQYDEQQSKGAAKKTAKPTWKMRLQDSYDGDFKQWEAYDRVYNLAQRLGFKSAQEAWQANPTIQGGVNPADFSVVAAKKKADGIEKDIAEARSNAVSPDTTNSNTAPETTPAEDMGSKTAKRPEFDSEGMLIHYEDDEDEDESEDFPTQRSMEQIHRALRRAGFREDADGEYTHPRYGTVEDQSGGNGYLMSIAGKTYMCLSDILSAIAKLTPKKKKKRGDTADNPANWKGGEGIIQPKTDADISDTTGPDAPPPGQKQSADISGDQSEAKAETDSPDTVDPDIQQPTVSVEEAAKVGALKTEQDTPEIAGDVEDLIRSHDLTMDHEKAHPVFEHGQWWVVCDACGAIWNVVDAEGANVVPDLGLDLEEIETGDGSCSDNAHI